MSYTGKKPVDFVDVTQSQSMTVSDDLTVGGEFTSSGIDDNATSTAMTIDSSGNVVVKSGKDLRINRPDDATFGAISHGASGTGIVYNDANGDGHHWQLGGIEKVRIDNSGRVGIGTSSPNTPFHVQGAQGYASSASNLLTSTTKAAARIRGANDASTSLFFGALTNDAEQYIQSCNEAGNGADDLVLNPFGGNVLVGTSVAPAVGVTGMGYGTFPIASYDTSLVLSYNGTGGNYEIVFVNNNGVVGTIYTTGSSTVYATSSDYRLKEDWQPMTGATERVKALNPVNFAWKADGSRVDGFLAHEAQEVVPEAVTGEKDAMREEEYEVTPAVLDEDGNVVTEAVMGTRSVPDYQGIDQSKLVPLLTAALQEAIAKIETLETKVAALENA